jgi:PAS domain S-box-containing protein
MNHRDKSIEALLQELQSLHRENNDLKRLITNLSEAIGVAGNGEAPWECALKENRDGVWDWNPVTNEVFFSKRWKEMLGFAEDELPNDISEWDKRLHPDDRDAVYAELMSHLNEDKAFYRSEYRLRCKDGSYKWVLGRGRTVGWAEDGRPLRVVGTHTDVTSRRETDAESLRLPNDLREALDKIKKLSGLLPICVSCKKIRDDVGHWSRIEDFLRDHSGVEFSHCICPECAGKLYPEFFNDETG